MTEPARAMDRVGMFLVYGDPPPQGAPASFNPHAYVNAVVNIIRTFVRGFEVPRLVEAHQRHFVVVKPFRDWRGGTASTVAMNGFDALPRGERARIPQDDPTTAWDDTGLLTARNDVGTGRGTPSYIGYTPSDFDATNAPIGPGDWAPLYADAVFVHEMVHAVRNAWGVAITHRFGDDRTEVWHMENTEEFYATVIMNMYNSQRRIPLHTAYEVQTRMRLERNTRGLDHPYLRLQHRYIEGFFRDIPTLAKALADLPERVCPYNPFRDYRENRYDRAPLIVPGRRPPALIGPPSPEPPLRDPWAS